MAAFSKFYRAINSNFSELNKAFITLIPKREGAREVKHFRPISLIGSVAKLIAKVLSMRLAAVIPQIISPAQSAFQKGKCIHDSYLFVQGCVKSRHRRAFDTVSWPYLLELLQKLGFIAWWRDCIAVLMSTTSSSLMLNRVPGQKIVHHQGLRQGDPPLASPVHHRHRPPLPPPRRCCKSWHLLPTARERCQHED